MDFHETYSLVRPDGPGVIGSYFCDDKVKFLLVCGSVTLVQSVKNSLTPEIFTYTNLLYNRINAYPYMSNDQFVHTWVPNTGTSSLF